MKAFSKLFTTPLVAAVVLGTALFGFSGSASAACWQYNGDGMTTSTTPTYNNICNVPYGVGNEADWVRVRQSTNGNVEDNQNNPDYTDSLTAACSAGDKFDVHYYVHNDASPDYNNNGSGSAVAHDVQLAMNAPLGTAASKFTFGGTLTASNAGSVQDTATLNCGSNQVQLSLVPGTVHVYSEQYGWKDLADSAVNSTTKLGSPIFGSGDQWGCWNYRIVVVYQVAVQKKPTPKASTGVCTAPNVTADNRTVKVTVNGSTQNATIVAYEIDFGDGTTSPNQTASHTYAKSVTKANIVTRVKVKFANGTTKWVSADDCNHPLTFATTPPTTPKVPPVLPNTGAGDLIGLFAAVTTAGAVAYRFFLSRRLGRE